MANPEAASGGAAAFDWQRDQTVFRTSLQSHWRLNDTLMFEGGVYATTTDLYHPISLLIEQQIETQGLFGRFDWRGAFAGRPADLYWGVSYRQGHVDQHLSPVMFPIADDSRREATGMEVFAEGRVFVTTALALVAGGSYGRFTRDYENRLMPANNDSLDDDWFAPRLGLLWQSQAGVQIYANITNSVEPPHYGALVQAPYPGFVPVSPQEAWTGEIGTRGRTGALVWDITLYRAELENELLSFAPGVGVPAAFFNADETVHQGVELALDWEIADGWLLRQSYSYSDFFFNGDAIYGDNHMPVAPEHQYRGTLRYTDPSGWFIAPNVEWRPGETWVDYANTLEAPGYTIWSVNAGWHFDNGVSLFVDARNLSEEAYAPEFGAIVNASAPGANTAVFYPGEGRAVYGGVSYRF
jgi:iron complex outermembrane receptor protein